MSALSLFLEMLVIFILISIGFILYRTGKIADGGMKTMSFLVVNFCNPAIILNAAMQNEEPIAPALMGNAVLVTVLIYAILIGSPIRCSPSTETSATSAFRSVRRCWGRTPFCMSRSTVLSTTCSSTRTGKRSLQGRPE